MAYPYLPGANSEAFKGLSVLIGLMISLGGSSVVSQGASGLMLMYTHTLRAGEFVRIGEHERTVVELARHVRHANPHRSGRRTDRAELADYHVSNDELYAGREGAWLGGRYHGHDRLRRAWRQVHAMLAEAARRIPGVLADPPPRAFQTGLSDFYVAYRLVCHAMPSEPAPVPKS